MTTLLCLQPCCSAGGGATFDALSDTAADAAGDGGDMHVDDRGDASRDSPPPDTAGDALRDDARTDVPRDTASEDIAGEEGAGVTFRTCVLSCTAPGDCCTSASCGVYPDKWSCDEGYCKGAGCDSDAECAAWAGGYGLPGAENYKCRGREGMFHNCVQGCVTPDDCCNPYIDCSSYPMRYVCDDGGCLTDGCTGDDECRSYAAEYGLFRPDLYVCRLSSGTDYHYCVQSCSTETDCCPPEHGACTSYPYHYNCSEGLCTATCSSDAECRQYASSSGLPNAERYICREF
jgi:hypothetical protein